MVTCHKETHQDGTDEAHLKDRGSQIEDEGTEDKRDAPRTAVDGLGQRSRLAAEMETQVQIVQVEEDVLGDASDGALGHLAKHSVPQLVEEGCTSPGRAIWDSGGDREFSTPAVKTWGGSNSGAGAPSSESASSSS